MRFTLIKDIKQDKMMKPILNGLLLFLLFYLIADIFVKSANFGISIETIMTTLFGNEEEYIDPITTAVLLEFWHGEIFYSMMILLTLSTIFIRVCKSYKLRLILLNTLMLSALLSLIALPLAYFVSSFFVYIYLYTFFLWHISAIYIAIHSLIKLYND